MDASIRRRWSIQQAVVVAIAALPLAASLGFHAVDPAPHEPASSGERPALVFDQYLVNRREIRNAPRVEEFYRFKNCGKGPVRIVNIEPSCGCLKPNLQKRTYMPGEVCSFTLSVLTTHQKTGPHEYDLKVDYEDPVPRSVTVALKFDLLQQDVRLHPSQLMFFQNDLDETEQTVTVTDMRAKPFHITGASCLSSLVKASVGKPIDDPEGGQDTPISITVAAKVPEAGELTAVYVTTDDPLFPKIPIPLMIRRYRPSALYGALPPVQSDAGTRPIKQASGTKESAAPPRAAH